MATKKTSISSTGGHPLFPRDPRVDAEYVAPIGHLRISRWHRSTQKWSPRIFGADEVRTHEDIAELFGGGTYEIVALDDSGEVIVARRKFSLPGASLPLHPSDVEEEHEVRGKAPSPAPSMGPDMTQLLMLMMQQSAQQNQQMVQFMATFVEASRTEARATVEASKVDARAMIEMMTKSQETNMRMVMELLARNTEKKEEGGVSLSPDQMFEIASELAEARHAGDDGGLNQTVATIAEAFKVGVQARQQQQLTNGVNGGEGAS
jgi:hypothetical protein